MKTLITLFISLLLATSVHAAPKKAGGDTAADGQTTTEPGNSAAGKGKKATKGKGKNRKKRGSQDNRAEPQDPTDALAALSSSPDDLLTLNDVVGTGVSWDKSGAPFIKVYVSEGKGDRNIPKSIGEFSVRTENVGNVYALNVPCELREGNGKDGGCKGLEKTLEQNTDGLSEPPTPQEWHERPAPIGVSVGSSAMAPGTLGCRVSRGCHSYVLTNSHLVADDTLLTQPAAYDEGNSDDAIAQLFEASQVIMNTLPTTENRVDAAIYQVSGAVVDTGTRSNGYGNPMAITRDGELDLDVMKYGRTTAQTHGYIDAVGVTMVVNYEDGSARFVDQIVIKSDDTEADFALPGDSGSLVVGDGGEDDRKPVGLLFASGKRISLANPIDDVLNELDIDIDGDFE